MFSLSDVREWLSVTPVPDGIPRIDLPESQLSSLLFQREWDLEQRSCFQRSAFRLATPEEVSKNSNVEFSVNPQCERLEIHHIDIIREGRRRSRLDLERFRFIQPESARQSLVYDGAFLAVLMLEDVRTGDVIDLAWTTRETLSCFPEHHFGETFTHPPSGAERFRVGVHAPRGLPVRFRTHRGQGGWKTEELPDGRLCHSIEASGQKPYPLYGHAPSWFSQLPGFHWTTFSGWKDLSRSVEKLWSGQIRSGQHSPLFEETLAELRLDSLSPEDRLDRVIGFVQREIRYLSLAEGIHSMVPRKPDEVLRRRFGDCKDKSILLAVLLNRIGVRSGVALVSARLKGHVADHLPSPQVFDHVICYFQHGDRVRWVDPTIQSQGGNWEKRIGPDFERALPILGEGAELVPIESNAMEETSISRDEEIHLEDDRLTIRVTTVAEGLEADRMRNHRASVTPAAYAESMREWVEPHYPGAAISEPMEWSDDIAKNRIVQVESYRASGEPADCPAPRKGKFHPLSPALLAGRILALPDGPAPEGIPIALPYPLNLKHSIRFHHDLAEVDWERTTEEIKGPGFRYDLHCSPERDRIHFEFEFVTTRDHIESHEALLYTAQLKDVFSSMSRGYPHRKRSFFQRKPAVLSGRIATWSLIILLIAGVIAGRISARSHASSGEREHREAMANHHHAIALQWAKEASQP